MSTETFDALRDIIASDHAIPPETLTPGTPLESLKIDSLALIELIFTLEEKFDVIADNVPQDLPTLGSVAEYIDGLVQSKAAGTAEGVAPTP